MIEIAPGYRTGEMWFPTIQQAQVEELLKLMNRESLEFTDAETKAAQWIVENTEKVVAILTFQPKAAAKRKPRSDIGKKREKNATPAMVLNTCLASDGSTPCTGRPCATRHCSK